MHATALHLPALQFGFEASMQVPHTYVCPQPSGTEPQSAACATQFFGLHAQAFVCASHPSDGLGQPPQSRRAPQPLSTLPQLTFSSGQVFGTHAHLPAVHAPALQVPQTSASPQPSFCVPHSKPCI